MAGLCAGLLGACSARALTVILRQPTDLTVGAGQDALFTVGVLGVSPLAFQWRHDGTNLSQGINADLAISHAQMNDAGRYNVLVTDALGSTALSLPADLAVVVPLSILTQPQSQNVPPGAGAVFSVTATGAPPLRYQWSLAGIPLLGATNSSWPVAPITGLLTGIYSVRVWNLSQSLVSDPASLVIIDLPLLTAQPESQSAPAGGSASFSVTATGTGPFSYQWLRNGDPLPGQTNQTVTFENLHPEDEADLSALISNAFGVVTSAVAHLEVFLPTLPFADHFAEAMVLTNALFVAGRSTNFHATREPLEPLHDGKRSPHSVWLSWTAPVTGIVSLNTLGSDFDTVLAVYTGGAVHALTPVESDDDSGLDQSSALRFNAVAGTTYHVAVAGYLYAQGHFTFALELLPTLDLLPTFLSHPRSFSVRPGERASFQINFASDEPAQLQWLFQGVALSNATQETNEISEVGEDYVGPYRVRLTTPTRVIYSRPAELQINTRGLAQVLAHDKLGEALDSGWYLGGSLPSGPVSASAKSSGRAGAKSGSGAHGFSGTQIFSTLGSSREKGEPVHCGIAGGHSEWFVYQAEADGTLRLDTEGSNFDTVLAVYVGPGDSFLTLTNVACDNNSGSNGRTSKVIFAATRGTIYWIAVDGVGSAAGTVHLNINLGNPVALTTSPQSQTAPSGTNVLFTVLVGGMTNYHYQWRHAGINLANATNSFYARPSVQAGQAGAYDVVVRNPINTLTSSVATLTIYSGTLDISSQPQSVVTVVGSNVLLAVSAGGAGALTYQWRWNGTNLVGANDSLLSLTNVQPSHAGLYAVSLTDANGSLLSAGAALTVLVPPAITLPPASHTVTLGTTAALSAGVSGTPAPVLQWFRNGTALPGATTATLHVDNFQSENEGTYFLLASNSAGLVQTPGAELLLDSPLRLNQSAWSHGVFQGRVIGRTGAGYVVQCSTNTTEWLNVATNSSASGLWNFTDSAGTNGGIRLYRALSVP